MDYIRLGPSLLYQKPDCYLTFSISMKCRLCPVKGQCSSHVLPEGVEAKPKILVEIYTYAQCGYRHIVEKLS